MTTKQTLGLTARTAGFADGYEAGVREAAKDLDALKAQNEELAKALRWVVRTAKTCEAWNGVALDYNAAIERARSLLSRLNDKGEGL